MILYFSATGNSKYVAEYIGNKLDDEVVDLLEFIREKDYSPITSDTPWVVVVPTYAWRMPQVVREFIRRTDFYGNKKMYFVMTCGQDNGSSGRYLKRFCDGLCLEYMGCAEIVMPDNYMVMFPVPEVEEAIQIIEESKEELDRIIDDIKQGLDFPKKRYSILDCLKSGVVNAGFQKFYISAKRFHATDKCVSCEKCVQVCPLQNITLQNGIPVWGESCTHCMACICRCPQEAIEYGKKTVGKRRYICPMESKESPDLA